MTEVLGGRGQKGVHEDEEVMHILRKITISSGPPDMLLTDREIHVVESKLRITDWKAIDIIAFYVTAYIDDKRIARDKK